MVDYVWGPESRVLGSQKRWLRTDAVSTAEKYLRVIWAESTVPQSDGLLELLSNDGVGQEQKTVVHNMVHNDFASHVLTVT